MDITLPNGQVVTGVPEGTTKEQVMEFAIKKGYATAEDFGQAQQEAPENKGVFASVGDWITGKSATTPSIDQMPTIMDGGFFEGESLPTVAKIAMATALTSDQNEIANIIQKQVPSVKVVYNKDGEGNIYPILVNKNGMTAMIDKPGVDLMNIGQFLAQSSVFMAGGPAKNIPMAIALDTTREAGLQGVQASMGGEFDADTVAVSGGIGGAFKGVENIFGMAYRAFKGEPTPEVSGVLSASDEWNVPVATTDIYSPKTWFGRGVQWQGEATPIIGTGGFRYLQQDQRRGAIEQFQSLYLGGTYDDLINDMAKRSKEMKDMAGAVYNRIDPYLEQQSLAAGMNLNGGNEALESVISKMTNPKERWSDSAIAMLDDIQAMTAGGQSYMNLKHNLSAWEFALNKMDSGLTPTEKREIKGVLHAYRSDRNKFAQSHLNEADFSAYEGANSMYGEAASNLKQTRLKNIFEKGDVTPEVARTMLYSNKASEVDLLFDNLTPEGVSVARSVIVTDIMDKMARLGDGDILNPDLFIKELRKKMPAISKAWEGREEELFGFINLMDVTRRAQVVSGGAGSPTAERQLVANTAKVIAGSTVAGGAGLAGVPWGIVGAYASIGGIARMLESPIVRNILVKMNSLEPGSKQAQVLASRFNEIVRISIQAEKDESEASQQLSKEITTRAAPITNSRF